VAHAVSCQALVHHVRGDLDTASRKYEWALKRAQLTGDTELMAIIGQNLGAIASIRGDAASALEHYRASLDGFRSLDLKRHLVPLRAKIGRLQTDLRMWNEASRSLQIARDECLALGQVSDQILVEVNRARLAFAQGHHEDSRKICDVAHGLARIRGEHRWMAEIHKQYGMIYRDTGEPQLAREHLERAENFAMERQDLLLRAEVAAELGLLNKLQGRNRDTLVCLTRAHRLFTELQATRQLASLDSRRRRFESQFLEVVESWGRSIDDKDPYTQGHCNRVADYACRLAAADGFDPDLMIWFRMGALLHDVGKVVVPIEILNKPGPLDEDERAVMRQHPSAGADLLSEIAFPWDVIPMVRHHHERWDGEGYPSGLAASEIPRSAQILMIADVFDALTSERSYRAALSREQAASYIRQQAGTAFNPDLAGRFSEIVERGDIQDSEPDGPSSSRRDRNQQSWIGSEPVQRQLADETPTQI
jgi:putative nucleotidyltransferase with HDIG domain